MNTWDNKHTCTFTGHRPERLALPEEQVKEWLLQAYRNLCPDKDYLKQKSYEGERRWRSVYQ